VEAVKSATMPSLRLKLIIKSCMNCSDFSFGTLHGLSSQSLHSWVLVMMRLKITSSTLKSTMGNEGLEEITSSWGWRTMEDEEEANERTKRGALNFKVYNIIWTTLQGCLHIKVIT
jgi:hypothetical protein